MIKEDGEWVQAQILALQLEDGHDDLPNKIDLAVASVSCNCNIADPCLSLRKGDNSNLMSVSVTEFNSI